MPAATLAIPPDTEHVRTARLVSVAAARRAGLAEDAIDDVRLAVGELVAGLVRRRAAEGSRDDVELVLRDDGRTFSVEVGDDVLGAAEAGEGDDDDVALALVRAVVPEVDRGDGGTALRWPVPDPA
ncbi:MAG: ATP-binding protein [Frankiales bacterium]|nr:ATP-binding protein [Frankiales bacterium]